MQQKHYDYIITGGGLAGMSLLYYILNSKLKDKKILILDQSAKEKNDRTWCYWEQKNTAFDFLVHHRWEYLDFHTFDFSKTLNIKPYQYKMIRSIDFYNYCKDLLSKSTNVDNYVEKVIKVENLPSKVLISTDNGQYSADFCFNSILFEKPSLTSNIYLDQHFKGWIIQTETPAFDPTKATLMDFRLPHDGETKFVYVLPTSTTEALIEATLFSEKHLTTEAYDDLIKGYIQKYLPTVKSYKILHEEFGVIPMTDYSFSKGEGRILNIGTAGGHTKASSGYTFWYVQNKMKHLVEQLEKEGNPPVALTLRERIFSFLDHVFLNVLKYKRVPPPQIFGGLFKHNTPVQVLKFMSEQTSFLETVRILLKMQILPFFKAMLHTFKSSK